MTKKERRLFNECILNAMGIPYMKPSKKVLDERIINTVNMKMAQRAVGSLGCTLRPQKDLQYFAHNIARAGVDKEAGWAFVKKNWPVHDDSEEDTRAEYDKEYDNTPFEQSFRDRF